MTLPRGIRGIINRIKRESPAPIWERNMFAAYHDGKTKAQLARFFGCDVEEINLAFRRRRNDLHRILTSEDLDLLSKGRRVILPFANEVGCAYHMINDMIRAQRKTTDEPQEQTPTIASFL